MLLATDAHYHANSARVAGVLFPDWGACQAVQEVVVQVSAVADYEPGQFYKRELPCLLALLDQLAHPPQCILVDGYVHLGEAQRPGLGHHLYHALDGRIPVVGVAKSYFQGTPPATAVYRGRSQSPLYVTAIGINEAVARESVGRMCGPHRLPTLLKQVDQLCRQKNG